MAQAPIHCSIITPEAQVLDAHATSVVLPAHDGQTGVLNHRAPMLTALGTGVLRVDTPDKGSREFFVDGGFAQVLNNDVTILTERAAEGSDINRIETQKALRDAEAMPLSDTKSVEARTRAVARAKAQLKIAKK